jgi:hypothetical protein
MPPRPAWAQAAVPDRRSTQIQSSIRKDEEVDFLFILAISHEIVDIQTFE